MNGEKRRLILSVETATRGASLAVLNDKQVCAVWRGDKNFSTSNGLLREIQNILDQIGAKIEELNLLSVVVGPGSFTDLRIGLAIVKGLAAVWEIPIIGVPTLQAMAFDRLLEDEICCCSLLSAGREEFFSQTFRGRQQQICDQMRIGPLESILTDLQCEKNLHVIAPQETRQRVFEFIERKQIKSWSVISPPENLAVCVGKIAFDQFRETGGNSCQLIYGRDAVASKKHD
jgi:tRNA threonylcarbamoyladenosine biosynthesis protein TsaB